MRRIGDTWVLRPSASVVDVLEQGLEYHEGMIATAASFCTNRRTFLDVGACYGLITRQMSALADHVQAFEPNSEVFPCLVKNTEDLPNVTLLNVGLSDRAGHARLVLYDNDSRSTYARVSPYNLFSHKASFKLLDTQAVTLDSLRLTGVDLIKVDVEKHEKEVIKGSLETIARCRPVIVLEQKPSSDSAYYSAALSLMGYEVHSVFRGKDHLYVHRESRN